jgi:septum formation protein
MTSDVEEDNAQHLPPADLTIAHAEAKAKAVAAKKAASDIVIGADTIVVLEDKVYGKPRDNADAERMLRELSGKEHHVITGVAVVSNGKVWTDYAVTAVKLKTLSGDEIQKYIATGEPADKAGAYAIQGVGALFVERIFGCYPNVVGLPLVTLDNLLHRALGVSLL